MPVTGIGRGFPFARVESALTLERVAEAIDEFPGLSRVPALLVVLLGDMRLHSHEYLRNRMDDLLGWTASGRSISDAVKRARPIIAAKGYKIETVPGVGYRLCRPNKESAPCGS